MASSGKTSMTPSPRTSEATSRGVAQLVIESPKPPNCHPEREGGGWGGREGSPHKSWCRSTGHRSSLTWILVRLAVSGTEPECAQDHGETPGDVRGHADDQRPLPDTDPVDEVNELSSEEEQIGQDRYVVRAAAFPDPQRLWNVGGTRGDTDDGDEPGEKSVE